VSQACWHRGEQVACVLVKMEAERFAGGFRIVQLQIDDDGDDCSALWRPRNGAQHWKSRRTVSQIESLDKDYFKLGLRIQ